jgi:hypothetical protein
MYMLLEWRPRHTIAALSLNPDLPRRPQSVRLLGDNCKDEEQLNLRRHS